jgi:endonuclease/exonuclease/phosphatase family metal-dependent hydrolase
MAKSWLRKTGKKTFILFNLFVGVLFLIAALSPFISPSKWWLHGFLALLTPFIILILLLFILTWLIIRPLFAIIPALFLLIGFKQVKVLFAWNNTADFVKIKPDNNIRVVDWNIHGFNGVVHDADIRKRVRNELANSILKNKPDIICLQEFNTANNENNIELFTQTHPFYYFSRDYAAGNGHYELGCIIFSKYKIIDSGRVAFPNDESIIFIDVRIASDTFRVFTTHLQSFKFQKGDYEDIRHIKESDAESISASMSIMRKMKKAYKKRGIQADIVQKQLAKSPHPYIITGDFNDVPNSYTYFTIKQNLKDAFLEKGFGIGRSFVSLSPTLRIDYILAHPSFDITQFEMLDESLSDHNMLMADLHFKK